MSDPEKRYRLYCYDAEHRVVTADWLEAGDDESAIAAAHEAGFGTKCEIWDGKRLVAQLSEDGRRSA